MRLSKMPINGSNIDKASMNCNTTVHTQDPKGSCVIVVIIIQRKASPREHYHDNVLTDFQPSQPVSIFIFLVLSYNCLEAFHTSMRRLLFHLAYSSLKMGLNAIWVLGERATAIPIGSPHERSTNARSPPAVLGRFCYEASSMMYVVRK